MKRIEYSPLHALFALAPGLRRATDHTLSLYLPARQEGYDARHYDIVFGDVRHRYRERLDAEELEVLESELPRLRLHVAIAKPAGCAAIAAFAQSDPDLVELFSLPAPTPERLEVGDPLLAPALRQLEQFPPALVVVVDKEQARLFASILDEVVPTAGIRGLEVKHSRAGGTSAQGNQRKAENRARANLEAVVKETEREMGSGLYAQLYIAGPDEARPEFEAMLPHDVRELIAGRLGASLDSATLEHDLRQKLAEHRLIAAPAR
jgi:hypothetical protein